MQFRLTRTVKILLIANLAAFILQHTVDRFFGGNFIGIFGLVPSRTVNDFMIWQPFTYAFLHGDVTHLFLNLMMLLFIGTELEALWGWKRFVRFYTVCAVTAGIAYLILQVVFTGQLERPMVGASGAIFGLLAAYGILFSDRSLLFMMVFPLKAKHFVWVLAGIEFMTLVFSPGGGLSSVAHLTGMGAGVGYLWIATKVALRLRENPKKRKGNLKLVVNNQDEKSPEPPPARKDNKTWH